MTARQMRVLAGSAGALAAAVLALAGCAAASHLTASDVPRPASQAAARAGTAVRLGSPLAKCADLLGPGNALGGAGGAEGTTGQARQMAALAGSTSPAPLATLGRATPRRLGVVQLSQYGLVMLCEPVILHCPHGFRAIYPRDLSGGRPRALLRYRMVCITRFPLRSLPPAPRLTPMPEHTMPLNTLPPRSMPPQAAG
jgi:hypothetical protein